VSAFASVLGASALAGVGSLAGTALVLWRETWVRRWSLAAVALAAGAMATTALSHLVPEAIATHGTAPYWTLAGFGFFFVLNQVVSFHACGQGLTDLHPIGTMALVGILTHSLFDGVAIGAAFGKTEVTGRIVAATVFLHELPEGAITVVILLHTGLARSRALLWGVVCALLTPLGAILTAPFASSVNSQVLGALLGISAGSFLYVAATNLLPETRREGHRTNALAFVLGVGLILGLTQAAGGLHVGHDDPGHAHTDDHSHPHD
jgi:zinc and cadmium transporter